MSSSPSVSADRSTVGSGLSPVGTDAAPGPDPLDRRAVGVELTAAGRRALTRVTAARERDADELFGRLTDHERASLRRILRKLVAQ